MGSWSLQKGLKKLGYALHNATGKNGLIGANPANIEKNDVLFFTQESFLKKYQNCSTEYHFYPKILDIPIDDKVIFANWLETTVSEQPVPFLAQSIETNPPYFPIYVKSKHSWVDDIEMPKGYISNNQEELNNIRHQIKQIGLKNEYFFFQKLVEGDINNTYSTCGFYDCEQSERNLIIVQQKCSGTGQKITTSTITQTVRDPETLIKRTENILNRLHFKGPFELEFIYDSSAQTYFVLELNPRFWMQHGVFIDFYDNYIIKCYLDIDTNSDRKKLEHILWLHVIWVDTFALLIHPIRTLKKLYTLKKQHSEIIFYPNFFTAIRKIVKCWNLHTCTKSEYSIETL
jgi:hypothetical protein